MARSAHSVKPQEDRHLLGITLVILAVLMFTGIDTSAKWLTQSGLPAAEIVFVRYAIHLALALAFLLPTQGPAVFRTNNPKLEIIRAIALLFSTIFNFLAVRFLPLAVTGAIMFAMPLVLSALSGPLLGERVGWRRWMAILIGFMGVLIVIQPGGAGFHPAMLLSLCAATCIALYNICTRKLAGVDSSLTQQVYSALVATLCIMPFAFAGWTWPGDPAEWTAFFAMGIFGGAGHLIITIAHRMAPASVLAPFVYPQILYMTASSWLIFAEPPNTAIFIGAPIVVGSGLYIWLRERQLSVKRKTVTRTA